MFILVSFILLKVPSNYKCLLSWSCWCFISLWRYPPCYIWKCGEMAKRAERSHRCPHCCHACRQQSRPASFTSSFNRRCYKFFWTGEYIFYGDICPWVLERWKCFHRSVDADLPCGKQKGPWDWRWSGCFT